MSEQGIIKNIKYTLEHYSEDINDLEWSTEQINALLSSLEKAQKETEKLKTNELLFPTLAEFSNLQDDLEKEKEKVRALESIMTGDPNHWDGAYVKWATEKVESNLKKLVKAIKKHKKINKKEFGSLLREVDEELYRVLEVKEI